MHTQSLGAKIYDREVFSTSLKSKRRLQEFNDARERRQSSNSGEHTDGKDGWSPDDPAQFDEDFGFFDGSLIVYRLHHGTGAT